MPESSEIGLAPGSMGLGLEPESVDARMGLESGSVGAVLVLG